ncbi:hypothetical protein GF352_01820|nr:hypothetical protein [archaeon]
MIKGLVKFSGRRIILSVKNKSSSKAVIFSHGFRSSKNNLLFQSTARSLARAGFKPVLFNYGVERVNKRVQVLRAVINHVKSDSIGLLGHSLGGMVSILLATNPRVKSLALVNTVYEQGLVYDNYARVRRTIAKAIPNRFKKEFFSYNLKRIVSNLEKPVIVVSGEDDQVTPQPMMKRLYNDLMGEKSFVSIPNAGHSIWRSSHLRRVRVAVRDWFKRTL